MFNAERFSEEEPENTQAFVFSALQGLYRQHCATGEIAIGYDCCGEAIGMLAGVVSPDEATPEDEWFLTVKKYGPLDAEGRYDVAIGFYNPATNRDEKATNYYDTARANRRIGANPCDDMRLTDLLSSASFSRSAAEHEVEAMAPTLTPRLLLDGPNSSVQYHRTLEEIRRDFPK